MLNYLIKTLTLLRVSTNILLLVFIYSFSLSAVANSAPTITFYWSNNPIFEGESTHRVWSSTNADKCVGRNGVTSIGTSGSSLHKPQYADMSVTITCSGPGGSVSKTATLTVNPPPPPPTLSFKWVPSTIIAGETAHRETSTTNATSCIGNNGQEVGTSEISQENVHTVSKTVTKTCYGPGGSVSKTITLTVNPVPNYRPQISSISNKTINEDQYISITPNATDQNGDNLSFSITNKPSWATFSTSTGRLRGTPSFTDAGTYSNIKITASDGSLTDSETYSITVNNLLNTATLDSPANDATFLGDSVCFDWNTTTGANYYTIQVSSTPAFNASGNRWVLRDLETTAGCWSSSFIANDTAGSTPNPLPNGTYYWRVKSMDDETFGSGYNYTFSDYRSFTVNRTTPVAPISSIDSPQANETYTVSWDDDVAGANSYKLFENDIEVPSVNGTEHEFSKTAIGVYHYKVQACNITGCTAHSAVQSISIKAASIVRGYIEGISHLEDERYIQGWACQKYDNRSINVDIWVGGAADTGTHISRGIANEESNDSVAAECENTGSKHRFTVILPKSERTVHAGKKIYIHGISIIGTQHRLLGRSGELSLPDYTPPSPELITFTWQQTKVMVGEAVTLDWDISNIDHCTTIIDGEEQSFTATDESSVFTFYTASEHVTQWSCTDLAGNRFPADENEFIEAPITVTPLAAPQNLKEQPSE
ncbi:putative Ig domain-containing protein [Paraglaciecola sp.]|uniref:putative Ig domain-containing protein n=1 Tax=Paraglaciecola sp. TaxID=1920173 RepID=UPI003EF320B3